VAGDDATIVRIAAKTFSELVGVWLSDTTVWRCHGEVAGQLEQLLGTEEEQLNEWPQNDAAEEQVAVQSAVGERASVSVDGALIRIREEGYREVKMVSVSEVKSGRCPSRSGKKWAILKKN